MESPFNSLRFLRAYLLRTLVLGFLLWIVPAYAQRFPLHNLPVPGEQVFLKINDLYVFYLGPVTPFLSQDNVVYVPLRGMANLLNADEVSVAYRYSAYLGRPSGYFVIEKTKATGVEIRGSTGFTMNGNARTYELVDHIFWLQEEEDVLVPAATLTKALGIDSYWDPGTRIFEIRDPYALRGPNFLSARFASVPGYSHLDGVSTTAFLPQSMSVEHLNNGSKHFQVELQRLGNVVGSMNVIYGFGGISSRTELD